jgi:predicted PurR-regulated permease PerM
MRVIPARCLDSSSVSSPPSGDDGTESVGSGRSPGLGERGAAAVGNVEFRRGRVALWIAALLVLLVLLYVSWRYVGTVVLGLFAYYVTRPVFHRILARTSSRTGAVVASLLLVALPVLVLVGWTVIVAVRALRDFGSDGAFAQLEQVLTPYLDIEAAVNEIETVARQVAANPGRVDQLNVGGITANVVDLLSASVSILFTALLHAFVALVIVFYLLRDGHRVATWARRTFVEEGGVFDAYLVAVDQDLKNIYFGNILNALFTGLLAATTYTLLNLVAPPGVGIPEAALVGLLVGAASLVPVIGIKLVWVPVSVFLFATSLLADPQTAWFPVLFAVVSIVVVDYIPDQLLRPYVSGRSLHVGAVMIAYTLGPLLFGWYGIFLGPLVLVVVFEFGRIVFPWLVDPERARSEVQPLTELDDPETARAAEGEGEPGDDGRDDSTSEPEPSVEHGRRDAGESPSE